MNDDESNEPTTAAEMELMEELKRLMTAAQDAIERERTDEFEVDVARVILGLRALVTRAEEVAALRIVKGRPTLARDPAQLLATIHERATQLRDQLEDM